MYKPLSPRVLRGQAPLEAAYIPRDRVGARPVDEATLVRAEHVRRRVLALYEPGNQRRSLRAVWRRTVRTEFGICYQTMLRYLNCPRFYR